MATVQPTITQLESLYGHTHQVVWTPMLNGDVGAPYLGSGSADRSVQVSGTFGAGGSVTMEGTNVGTAATPTNFTTLHDPQGLALTVTSAKLELVAELTMAIRPNCTAGDGTTSLTVAMVVRRPL